MPLKSKVFRHVHEHAETVLSDGVEDIGVNAVTGTVDIGGALRDLKTGDVSLSNLALWI